MRKLSWILAAALALVAAGVAVAHGGGGAKQAKAVTGTFTATAAASDNQIRTCTNADGTWQLTNGTYTGTASSSEPDLNGPIRLDVRSVVNTTKDAGFLEGRLRIDTTGADTVAHFSAAYAAGKLAGLAAGHAHEPYAQLLANLSAGWSATGGFTSGKIGSTDGGAAIEFTRGRCEPASPPKPLKPVFEARGKVAAASSSSLTVQAGDQQVTCAVGSSLSADVLKLHTGDGVSVLCALVDGQYRLVSLRSAESFLGKPLVRLEGKVGAVSSSSLTVNRGDTSLTMSVPSSLASAVSHLSVGDEVTAVAARIDGNYVLVLLKAHG